MKPEERAIEQRQPLHQRIVPPRVLALVRQHGVKLRLRPSLPALRQNHRRSEPANGDRRRAQIAGQPASAIRRPTDQHVCTRGSHRQTHEQYASPE
jgi:hypothetical protein